MPSKICFTKEAPCAAALPFFAARGPFRRFLGMQGKKLVKEHGRRRKIRKT